MSGQGASKWQLSINVNTMSLAWYLPLLAYEAHAGSMLAAPALRSPRFWAFNFATASVGFALNIAAMLQAPPRPAPPRPAQGRTEAPRARARCGILRRSRT
jgi:hypothetical protein